MEKKQHVLRNWYSFILVIILFSVISCTPKNTARIRIKESGLKHQIAYIEEQGVAGAKILDSLYFSGRGVLKYELKLRQPTFYTIRIPSGKNLYLLVFPGNYIKVTIAENKPEDVIINGSSESQKLTQLYDSLFAARKVLDNIRTQYFATTVQKDKDSLYTDYNKILDGYRHFSMQFVLENMNSLVSIAALYQESGENEYVFGRIRDMQFFKIVTDSLTKYFPRHPYVIALENNYRLMYNTYQLERLKVSANKINTGIPDLYLPDSKGDTIILSSLKSKYVFLNFWDDDDQTSDKIFPSLKPVSEKYRKNGLSVYNVYVGKSIDLWKKIVKFEEIESWVNVTDTAFPYSKSRMSYNIQALPANYLIDLKNKDILLKDVTPQELDEYLSQNLKK